MTGVLADSQLTDMIARGEISARPAVTTAQIQPASLDLRLVALGAVDQVDHAAPHDGVHVDALHHVEGLQVLPRRAHRTADDQQRLFHRDVLAIPLPAFPG